MSVNKKIIEYLKKEKISQAELALKTGIAQQNLNRLLNSADMKVSQLKEITKALELPIHIFFDPKETQNKNDLLYIEELKSKLNFEKREFDSLNRRLFHISTYMDETFEFLIKNKNLLPSGNNYSESLSVTLRENIQCRYEYGYSKKHFEENILYFLNNLQKLPIKENTKEYNALFKGKK